MTTKQIQELLLTHYLFAEQMVEEEERMKVIEAILKEMAVQYGICWCAHWAFGENVLREKWLTRNVICDYDRVWGEYPYYANSKSQILSRLKLRVDILNKEIQLSK